MVSKEENGNMNEEETAAKLRDSLKKIFVDCTITRAEYFETHTHIYKCCIRNNENINNDEFGEPENRLDPIFNILQKFLDDHVTAVSANVPDSDQDEICLEFYRNAWQDYHLSSNLLNRVANYLNKQMSKRGEEMTNTVEQMAIGTWCTHLFTHLNKKVSDAALRMLERSRQGNTINENSIKAVVETYITLGVLKRSDHFDVSAHLQVYKEFEARVLEGTKEYYKKESEQSIDEWVVQKKSFTEYLKHIQKRLDEEIRLAKLLHGTTELAMRKVCIDALVTDHERIFDEEFGKMLVNDRKDELKLVCSVAVLSEKVIRRLNIIFEQHVLKMGLDAMEKCAEQAIKDPKLYIETILLVHKKFHDMVREQFNSESGFLSALDKACTVFINKNAVTKNGSDAKKCPELLANYSHMLLKNTKINVEEQTLEQIITIFKYVDDKDVFEKYYKMRLAERLIEKMVSADAEDSMIGRMKEACGCAYTNKLQRMSEDIKISKDLSSNFDKRSESSGTANLLDVRVLQNGSWPFKPDKNLTLPIELARAVERFTGFYNEKHAGRKLSWLYSRSKGDLLMQSDKKYTIKANTYQMTILLQYNDRTSHTIQELKENTGIQDMDYLKESVAHLISKNLLKSTEKADQFTEATDIALNENYIGPKIRFDISVRMKSEKSSEQKATNESIESERRFVIEAAIVRVMKTRKILKHQSLIGEVIDQVKSRFNPKVQMIKTTIDRLIEKEYLKRADGERDVYEYLA